MEEEKEEDHRQGSEIQSSIAESISMDDSIAEGETCMPPRRKRNPLMHLVSVRMTTGTTNINC